MEVDRNEAEATVRRFDRRAILLGTTALVAATAVGKEIRTASAQGQPASSRKPNILFMLVDNLGYGELGVYGGGATRGAPTPRIDRLASEGLRLTNMNMEAQCTPSRSAILTGLELNERAHQDGLLFRRVTKVTLE